MKGLEGYRRETGFSSKVVLTDFLNWFAMKRGAASPRALCLAMNKRVRRADMPWRRVAAATWIVRGGEPRRRRGRDVDSPWR